MTVDKYAECPCRSGKKIKFCCGDAAPLVQEIVACFANKEFRDAQRLLDRALARFPQNPFLRLLQLDLVEETGRGPAAMAAAVEMLRKSNPASEFSAFVDATEMLEGADVSAVWPAVSRALRIIEHPILRMRLLSNLAMAAAARGSDFARFRLLQMVEMAGGQRSPDSNVEKVPWLLLAGRMPLEVPPEAPGAATAAKALQLVAKGLHPEAAAIFEGLTRENPREYAYWYNMGLCRGWAMDDRGAAAALHRAADLAPDRAAAEDAEALSQMLAELAEHGRHLRLRTGMIHGNVDDLVDRLRTDPLIREAKEVPLESERFVGAVGAPGESDPTKLPLGHVIVMAASDAENAGSMMFLELTPGDLEAGWEIIEPHLADLVPSTDDVPRGTIVLPEFARAQFMLRATSDPSPLHQRLRLYRATVDELATDWLERPREVLGGLTPRQAAERPELSLALAGALGVFESHVSPNYYPDFLEIYRARLHLPELPMLPNLPRPELTVGELRRLDVGDLPFSDLTLALIRSQQLVFPRMEYQICVEILSRASENRQRRIVVLNRLAWLCDELAEPAEAWVWLENCRRELHADESATLDSRLECDLHLLKLILRHEPLWSKARPHLELMLQLYGKKVPQLREFLLRAADELGVILTESTVPFATGNVAPSGLWTPESAAPAPAGKLWIPGAE